MNTLRFLNPELQSRFLDDLCAAGLGSLVQDDGSVQGDDDQWPQVVTIAHHIRDSCYRWYFSWCENREREKELEEELRSRGLRYEREDHGDRLVFLLPKEDEAKHIFGDAAPAFETCSFCGRSWTDIKRFFTSDSAAICDACVVEMHNALSEDF